MNTGQEPLPSGVLACRQIRSSTDCDSRAENNQRTIHFESDRIVIVRKVHGVSMRVTMAIRKYDGIGVLAPNIAEGRRGFRVMLVHADPDLSVKLYEGSQPVMIDAALAEWSQYFGLPVLGLHVNAHPPVAEAQVQYAGDQPGQLRRGEKPALRRRGGTLAKRRPRLYARRQTGRLDRMDETFAGEREIIARD